MTKLECPKVKRHFPDWLTAYAEYAQDQFCPPKFHFWTGASTMAGALERKVWIQRESFNHYPNLYVLLVARPGMGKSSATSVGVNEFLRRLGSADEGGINFLASQSSEASFYDQMKRWKRFEVKGQPHTHSSGFLYASEASNSLKEMVGGGTIISALTEFYDCNNLFSKSLMTGPIVVNNPCCNVLAGCTFSFLRELIPDSQVEGGFASRFIYIIQDEIWVRSPKWNAPGRKPEVRQKLLEDLDQIYKLTGAFTPTDELMTVYEQWFPVQDAYRQSLESDRMQHFLARKHTNLEKLAMICSASESNSLILTVKHWERAMSLLEGVELNLQKIIDHSADVRTQRGLNHLVLKALNESGQNGILEKADLLKILGKKGADVSKIEHTLRFMHASGMIRIDISSTGRFRCQLLVDAQDYL